MNKLFILLLIASLVSACSKEQQTASPVSSDMIERHENFPSEFVAPRNVDVWLPDNYSPNKRYAVLYMHDGQMLFDSTRTWNKQDWGIDDAAGRLINEGTIRNTIVVGISNTELRHSEYFPQKPFESLERSFRDSLFQHVKRGDGTGVFPAPVCSDNYLKFITAELKPFIDSTYSTKPEKDNTFIAGSSMGGLISMYALCEYPDVFGGAACLSTHWPGVFYSEGNPIPAAFMGYITEHLPSPTDHKLYFDYGTETLDAMYEPFQKMADSVCLKHGFSAPNWDSRKFEGHDHSENSWKKRIAIPLTFLLRE